MSFANIAHTSTQPCHFYHTSVCNYQPCPYSHAGTPAGKCVNETCALCFKQWYSQLQPPSFNSKRIHLPHDMMSFMLPYRRPKQISKIIPEFQQQQQQQQQFQQQPLQSLFYNPPIPPQRQRSQSPQREIKKCDIVPERKYQSEDENWTCISCGFEQNSITITQCRQCSIPKINKKLDFEFNPDYDTELDYIFVIDFECTCTEDNSLDIMEIIEFPIVVIDVKKRAIVNTFSSFVKPTIHPQLSEFCTKLTGITQCQVDRANPLQKVLKAVDYFCQPYLQYNVAILNDCNSDMKQFLMRESESKNIKLPDYMKKFINLKKIFPTLPNQQQQVQQVKKIKDIDSMLKVLGLEFVGRKHSGIADAKNIARVVIELLNYQYKFTTRLMESIYPYRMTLGNQNYKYMLLLSVQVRTKNPQKIKEIGGVIINLHKNQVIWGNVFHHIFSGKELNDQQQYKEMLEELQKNIIDKTDLKNNEFLIGTMGRKHMDLLKFEFARCKIDTPKYFGKWTDLRKEIPEMRKKKEKKNCNNQYLIEEAMRILEIPQQQKIEQSSSSALMDSMSLSQIVRKLVIKGQIFSEQ